MRLAIIANPIAGGGRPFKRIERLLRAWPYTGWTAELHPTRCAGHAGALALEILEHPPDLLAVCGGDGTLNDVVSHVPEPPFPMALLPAGTANVLAREIGLSLDPITALDIALRRVVRRVDLGTLQGRSTHRFLSMAGIGFDAFVVSKIRPGRRRLGIGAFYAATLRAFLSYSFPEFLVHVQGETFAATSCLIANARTYGGGLVITPDADMCDGLLDILILQGKPRPSHMRFIISAWFGRPHKASWVRCLRAPIVRIDGARGVWVQADGELAGSLPVDVSLTHASFPLVVPE